MKNKRQVQQGDVFATRLEDGRRGAIRIIKIGPINRDLSNDFYLTAVTTYIGDSLPKIDNPSLTEILVENRFSCRGTKCIAIYGGKLPSALDYVGNIPLSRTEKKLKLAIGDGTDGGHPLCGSMDDQVGYNVFLEWRWENNRATFEEEVQKRQQEFQRRLRLPQKPKKMMSETAFWAIIDKLDWKYSANSDKVLKPAIQALASKPKVEICRFEERLAFLLYQLDTKAHASNIGEYSYVEDSDYVSVDGFLHARCMAVAKGKAFYDSALKDPRKMPKDVEFESLLHLASMAYEQKIGGNFDYVTGCSYESFSNSAGWTK